MNLMKKLLSVTLAGVLCVSAAVPAMAAGEEKDALYHRAVGKYETGTHEFIKISHPEKMASTSRNPQVDGVLDYLGQGKLGVPGVDLGANNQGDRGQTYSWAAVAYGDWVYVSTLYNAMMSTVQGMANGGEPYEPDIFAAGMDVLFRGDFFMEEEDGANPGCALSKINVKTGEVQLLLSKATTCQNYMFRNGLVFQDKIYFCGNVNGIPEIVQIDPATDAVTSVYREPSIQSREDLKLARQRGISPAIRGMAVYNNHLVITCQGLDENPYLAISADPTVPDSFVRIASSYDENRQPGDLFGYPAYHRQDAIFGGSIWEMIEFNDRLYVAICTGTRESMGQKVDSIQSFAIVRGDCDGDPMDPASWNWTAVVGDEDDGAKYVFGIDPERTRSSSCNMMVYGDHLYIGEYNDTEIALENILFDLDFKYMADNLEQSVSLYRMDKEENIELVAGTPTEMFPRSLTGLNSGFGTDGVRHESQYTWQMRTFRDKLYIGTFDEGTLLYPLAQISNGDLLRMDQQEWMAQLNYLKIFMGIVMQQTFEDLGSMDLVLPSEKDIPSEITAAAAAVTDPEAHLIAEMLQGQLDLEEMLPETEKLDILDLPVTYGAEPTIDSMPELQQMLYLMGHFLTPDTSWSLDEMIQARVEFHDYYQAMLEFYDANKNEVPEFVEDIYEAFLNREVLERLEHLLRCLHYLRDSERGFDMFEFDGTTLNTITTTGMGDPFNHGLRVFAINESEENPWLCIGTANPSYGTQIWRMEGENLNLAPNYKDVTVVYQTEDGTEMGRETVQVSLDAKNVSKYLLTAPAGYDILQVSSIDADNQLAATVTEHQETKPSDPKPEPRPEQKPVNPGSSTPALNTRTHAAFIQGYEDGTVRPNGNITRAEAVTIFYRLMEDSSRRAFETTTSPFGDVAEDAWFNRAVSTMYKAGIIVDSKDQFRPNEPITRAELAVMAAQFTGKRAEKTSSFTDVKQTHWAAEEIAMVEQMGWIKGYPDGTFKPDATITRAEAVAVINRMTGRTTADLSALAAKVSFPDNPADAWFYADILKAAVAF